MPNVQAFANKPGNERRAQVKEAINRFLEKDEIRRTFEVMLPQKSLMVPLKPVRISNWRIASRPVKIVEYGGKP